MKLSTKLLLALLTLAVFGLIGTNLVLKAEYEKINFADPFWNYRRIPLKSFRHVNLTSSMLELVEIRQGTDPHPVVYVSKELKDSLDVYWNRDTLQLGYRANSRLDGERYLYDYTEFADQWTTKTKASVIVVVPQLASLTANRRAWLRLSSFRLDSLALRFAGPSALVIRDSRLGLLNLTLRDSAFASLPRQNQLGTLVLDAADKTKVQLSAESIRQFRPILRDERVELRVSGKALRQVIKPD